ncbi:MAG TPA: hypothetical protein VFK33_06380 [Bacillales bacterium]|nr:hypothetical protein [Bacillales bacterium]
MDEQKLFEGIYGIQKDLKTVLGLVETNTHDLRELKILVDVNTDDIKDLKKSIEANTVKLGNLQEMVAANTEEITALKSDNNHGFTNVQDRLGHMQTSFDVLVTRTQENEVNISN